MRILVSGLALLVASALPVGAEVTVRLGAGRVDIIANAAPLSEVLDRLARQTGMKVVYDGPAPRQLVTVSLLGRLPTEAVHDLLEGQGLNYALLGDSAGTGVQTLLMTGSTAPAASSATSSFTPASRPRSGPPPMSSPDSVDEPEEEPDEEPSPEKSDEPGTPNEGLPAALQAILPSGQALGAAARAPISANPAGTANAPAPVGVPRQFAPALQMPANTNPGFVPVSPLSPLGPFAPVMPGGAPVGGLPGGTPVGGPGAPNEPPEPTEPPLD